MRFRSGKVAGAVAAIAVALLSPTAFSASWRVELDGSGDFSVIQDAVNAAASGDTIVVGPGWYQHYERVQLGATWYRIMAFWDDARDLVFIGSGVGMTTWGPDSYEDPGQFTERFRGIQSYNSANQLVVAGISFVNLHYGLTSLGEASVRDCDFADGVIGLSLNSGANVASACSFSNYSVGVSTLNCTSVEVVECSMSNAYVYFSNTADGVVRNCDATVGGLVEFFNSSGEVSNCTATPGNHGVGVAATASSTVEVHDNQISTGYYNLSVIGDGTVVTAFNNVFEEPLWYNVYLRSNASLAAYGNDIYRGATSTYMVRTENYGPGTTATVDMGNNHWGDQSDPDVLGWRIYDSGEDPDIHIAVNFLPIEGAPLPTESTSWGAVKSMFR